jgi:hypothetical protein
MVPLMILAILSMKSVAFGQDKLEEWNVEITPRFWYAMVNPNTFSSSPDFQQSNQIAQFPLYGLSIRLAPPVFGGSDILLTAFRGSDEIRGMLVSGLGISAERITYATRTDIELLYRTPVPTSNIHWFVGGRWVLLEEVSTLGSGLVFPATTTDTLIVESNFYIAEAGVSFSTPFDDAAQHNLFGNFIGGVGYEDQEVQNRLSSDSPDNSGVFPSADINIGYQYVISRNSNVHIRYRAFAFHEKVRDQFVVFHGPEVGLSIRF